MKLIHDRIYILEEKHGFTHLEAVRFASREFGLTTKQIAEVTDTTEANVKQYLENLDHKLKEKPYLYDNLDELYDEY